MSDTIRVEGLREFIRAADTADKATSKIVRATLREAAVPVRDQATSRFEAKFPGRPAKFGISVRRTGTVTVEERIRRTTGLRPGYGGIQMRFALLPALDANVGETTKRLERAVTTIAETLTR